MQVVCIGGNSHLVHLLLCVASNGHQFHSLPRARVKTPSVQRLKRDCRKLNTSPNKLEDKEILAKLLVTPPIKRIDLHFPLGLEVTARNLKGVTIKDALDAIYKQFKKKVGNCA